MHPSSQKASDRWHEVSRILDLVLELPPEERPGYLDRECGPDPELRAEVEAVLAGAEAPVFFESPARDFADPLVEAETRSDLTDEMACEPLIGPYRQVRELGRGGMGCVCLAERADGQFEQRVAIKVIKRGMDSGAILRRFLAERQVLARLNHAHIARLLDGGITAEGRPYFTMEYVEGEPLTHYCEERGLGLEQRLRLFQEVCEAVQYAHRNLVIHRDLKPSNILVTPAGEVKLVDFGIAKVLHKESDDGPVTTSTEDRLMTPEYAAPEQLLGGPVTAATDVYALGAILYELLTGCHAHQLAHLTSWDRERVICEVEPRSPSIVVQGTPRALLRRSLIGDLDVIVLKALRKDPSRRYPSVEALLEDLQRHRSGLPIRARPDSLAYRARKFVRRRRVAIAVAGVVCLGLAVGLGGIFLAVRGGSSNDLVASAAHRVAFESALELDPAISPDGRAIAFAADYGGPMRLYVTQRGGRPMAITDGLLSYQRSPRWSPDGSQIAFQAGGTIYVVPRKGGTPRALVTPARRRWVAFPAWSPDGQEVAYVEDYAVYARPAAGGKARRLVQRGGAPHSLAWSPDGKWIAFVRGNGAFAYGAKPWGSPVNLGNVAPSSIWVVPATGGEPVQVTDERALNTSPVWLPQGRGLAFVSNRQGERDVYWIRLDEKGRPTSGPRRVTTGLGAHTISLAPDGRHLAYAVYRHTSNIWSVPVPPRGPVSMAQAQQVTSGNQAIEGLAISPDGAWLAFDSDRSGNQDIYKVPIAGGNPIQVTHDLMDDFMSSWSPNGREIAYYSIANGKRALRIMSDDGGGVHPVVPLPVDQRAPGWSPDGMSLVFSSDATGRMELYVVARNRDSTWRAARRLTFEGGSAGRWSPRGEKIAFIRDDGIWLLATRDGSSRQLLRVHDPATEPTPELLQWAPDGRTIFYKAFDSEGRSSIWGLPAKGGSPRMLIRFDDPARQSSRPEFTSDGQRLFFTLTQREADVWEMELNLSD